MLPYNLSFASPQPPTADLPSGFFSPIRILPYSWHEPYLESCIHRQAVSDSAAAPSFADMLHDCRIGPRLLLMLVGPSWLHIALLSQECHEHIALHLHIAD